MRVDCGACRTTQEVSGLSPMDGGFGFTCDTCGHDTVLAPVEVKSAPPPEHSPPPARASDLIERRWAQIAHTLGDADAHHGFIELCRAHDHLPFAGACYLRTPDEDPRVTAYRQRVVTAAMIQLNALEAHRDAHRSSHLKRLVALTIAVLILALCAIGYHLATRYAVAWQANG